MPTSEQLKKKLLELGVLTLITVCFWIGYGVYSALTTSLQSQVDQEMLRKVPTNLDFELVNRLKDRKVIDNETLSRFLEERYSQDRGELLFSTESTPSTEIVSLQSTASASPSALTP